MIFERKHMDCSAVNMPAICTILYRNLVQTERELLFVNALIHNKHYFELTTKSSKSSELKHFYMNIPKCLTQCLWWIC